MQAIAPSQYPSPYQWFSDMDLHLFGEGKHYRLYEKFGAHPARFNGEDGVYFAVWTPHAHSVSVVGNWNQWNPDAHPMQRLQMGIWETFVPGIGVGEIYKFALSNAHGHTWLKTDPFGFRQELRPATGSIVAQLDYDWSDADWLEQRRTSDPHTQPISIYEVHLGSWLHTSLEDGPEHGEAVPVPSKPGARYLTYGELADRLIPYVKSIGYTHIELLPITEHPYDGSWGYQVVGYYAPTSRYGSPQEFKYFVDRCHQEGIGVILDWVPGHFPKDAHGLAQFDGTHLYEYADPRKGEHKGWGTLVFDYGRYEVRNFLIASALFWLREYHIDGIRVDAVASLLYLDYERQDWIPNQYGGRENWEAVEFLKQLNDAIAQEFPGTLSIAEESTTWEKVSHPTAEGGLGFTFKWNMGWMNDTLRYFLVHPQDRSNVHNTLTFSIWYAFTERFMLALSHDEVVHGKGHLFQKMPGDDRQKLSNLRAMFAYMFTHPGKKTLFMGMEFGQTREWNVNADLDWWLLNHEPHQQIKQCLTDLHQLYHQHSSLYRCDDRQDGFEWIDCNDVARGLISYLRKDPVTGEALVVVCNFKPNVYHTYWLGVREEGTYYEVLNTDDGKYGGHGTVNAGAIATRQWNSAWPYALEINVPALSTMIFKRSLTEWQ